MSAPKDPLFRIFEQHLYNSMVEDESTAEFLERVVGEYVRCLTQQGTIPHEHRSVIENDLKDEVLEMLRKRTYGHFSLAEFRKSRFSETPVKRTVPTQRARTLPGRQRRSS